ncbi:hypothetical protein EK21DRAFT_43781, partial [Setomelanomma holmii]
SILSHTWISNEDITINGLQAGLGAEKLGWWKITATCEQALQDGLDYAWVDTCCI